jgi:serine/threonine protein kinase
VLETQNNEAESSWVEVKRFEHDKILLQQLLAEGGQAHVYLGERREMFLPPVVVKRYKYGGVDLFSLQSRMELLMKTRRENDAAICTVFGVGLDPDGKVLVVMEKMFGDLRTLIDHRMKSLKCSQTPFDYTQTITMMIRIAQGMEVLHRCNVVHADLKASNILVTPLFKKGREKWIAIRKSSKSIFFDVKIGDFDNTDGVKGTAFWRSPEMLQAVKNETNPILSPAADVYSYAMVFYELLTGQVPFEQYLRTDYDVVILGRRPELPNHVNATIKELVQACWRAEPRDRPGWTWIIKTLKEEFLQATGRSFAQPRKWSGWISVKADDELVLCKRRLQAQGNPFEAAQGHPIEMWCRSIEIAHEAAISWEEVCAQGLGTKRFATWKENIVPEILPVILPISTVVQKIFDFDVLSVDRTWTVPNYMASLRKDKFSKLERYWLSRVFSAFNNVWWKVEKTWMEHVGKMSDLSFRKTINDTFYNEALEPDNLLGTTANYWIEQILATSEEWQTLQSLIKRKEVFQRWTDDLRKILFAWETVYVAFHNWHVKTPIAFIAWQVLDEMYFNWNVDVKTKVC